MQFCSSNDNLLKTLKLDLLRYCKESYVRNYMTTYFYVLEFRYIFWMRAASFSRKNFFWLPIHLFCRWKLSRLKVRLCISIPYNTIIGKGFYIGHIGGIVVNPKAIIGKNCNISCGVVIGETFRGERKGVPTIGDNVYIAPGAKIIGAIKVGNNVAIGANSVVTKDVPDNAVVVGVPAKVISFDGSIGYVKRVI